MSDHNLIIDIFRQVSIANIRSGYTKEMIQEKDISFAVFLHSALEKEIIDKWKVNPNDNEILEVISDYGFDFYNYFYIGNDGYEWVELIVNQWF